MITIFNRKELRFFHGGMFPHWTDSEIEQHPLYHKGLRFESDQAGVLPSDRPYAADEAHNRIFIICE